MNSSEHAGHQWAQIATGPAMTGKQRPLVGMLIFPGVTLLDLVGPQTVLAGPTQTLLISKTRDTLYSDSGIGILPEMTLNEAPADLDVLFIPGGPGQIAIMDDPEYMDFVADRGARAGFVTAVCTGSLVLGAAGLLRGYRATTHWAAHSVLAAYGAQAVAERVVVDRNRITGGGVTAGIDFGLTLLSQFFDEDIAKITQLLMEYDPQPPFDTGSPQAAGEALVQRTLPLFDVVAGGMGEVTGKILTTHPRWTSMAPAMSTS